MNQLTFTFEVSDMLEDSVFEVVLEIEFHIEPAEPDVGIMQAGVDEWFVVEANGSKDRGACDWWQQYICSHEKLRDALQDKCNEQIEPIRDDY